MYKQHSQTVPQSVRVQDYNYREANSDMLAEVNSQPDDNTTHGTQYLYDQHYKQKGDKETTETGAWYAQIRHQQHISQQLIITGKSNQYNLAPGQRIILSEHPLQANLSEGLIILSTKGQGNRTDSYIVEFTAIPFNLLKPYRPPVLPMPKISGTLPATITSPDNDTYGYLDTKGRYRVKFNFDLSTWKNGEESLWLRLAKPYSGDSYGFHFPLIDGTEVAIAFTDGNPNRPYIAHAMHDSRHPDHVSTANKHRNVIRTPANNKLRMDDKRGQEHIKLATEYGKTQLNIGHLVDNKKTKRGEGFELRTDEWGAIAANKGLYLTTQTEPKAQGKQLDMQSAITQLENALAIAKALQNAAVQSQAHLADTDSQNQLKANLTELAESGILAYAQEGIALTSADTIQLSTSNNLTITAENQADINAIKTITLSSGEALGLFAHQDGMKLFANQGDIEVQAQNASLAMAAKQDIKVDSVEGKITVSADKDITLICGGSYIKITSEGIELGTAGNLRFKSAVLQKMGPVNKSQTIQLNTSELNVKRCAEIG
jgi:type VI secretion system secreted protein VgrG